MIEIKIGGVPEHFNMPWHLALSENLFFKQAIDLKWTDYAGGTGAMAKALAAGELDMAIMLTEGAIVDIEKGADNTILGFFVKSPLVWGIHVKAQSEMQKANEIFSKKYAVSRLGSGSHLMASIHAFENDQKIYPEQFIIVNNLAGAVDSISKGASEVFFWEKFMTNQYVENQVFKRIGEFPTPWPCFVIVVKNKFLLQHSAEVQEVISIIEKTNANLKNLPNLAYSISEKYQLRLTEVEKWLTTVEWNEKIVFDESKIANIKLMLTKMGLI